MVIAGFHPLTLIDYPGQVACIIFTQGCNLRCGYCHNSQFIVQPNESSGLANGALLPEEFFEFLQTRKKLLDGVVISGGEPTLQNDLLSFLEQIKQLGFLVKLDTNGTNPEVLKEALAQGLLDYVAMDIKHDPLRYSELTHVSVDVALLEAARDLLSTSGIAHEFRTTVVPGFHDDRVIETICHFCEGAPRFVLQNFRPTSVLNSSFKSYRSYSSEELHELQKVAQRYMAVVEVRE